MQLVPAEYAGNEDILYEIYYAVSANDPSVDYNTANFENTYLPYPWTAQWTFDEVTGGEGKLIGSTNYVMTEHAGGPWNAGALDTSYTPAVLINLNLVQGADVGQYLLFCAVLARGTLQIPTDVACVQIQ